MLAHWSLLWCLLCKHGRGGNSLTAALPAGKVWLSALPPMPLFPLRFRYTFFHPPLLPALPRRRAGTCRRTRRASASKGSWRRTPCGGTTTASSSTSRPTSARCRRTRASGKVATAAGKGARVGPRGAEDSACVAVPMRVRAALFCVLQKWLAPCARAALTLLLRRLLTPSPQLPVRGSPPAGGAGGGAAAGAGGPDAGWRALGGRKTAEVCKSGVEAGAGCHRWSSHGMALCTSVSMVVGVRGLRLINEIPYSVPTSRALSACTSAYIHAPQHPLEVAAGRRIALQ